MKPIILASGSPRRKDLLKLLGYRFKVVPSDYKEDMTLRLSQRKLAEHLSLGKAKAVAEKFKQGIVVGADTFVVLKGKIIGKPKDANHANSTLKKLSGRSHIVITGFTVIDAGNGKTITKSVVSKVWFKKLTDLEIKNYIASGEPLDKAGAYGVQGKAVAFVSRIEGSFFNVVGLPLYELAQTLNKFKL